MESYIAERRCSIAFLFHRKVRSMKQKVMHAITDSVKYLVHFCAFHRRKIRLLAKKNETNYNTTRIKECYSF